jgi:hypothetical protein
MPSSGMLRRVALDRNGVSEELSTSIIRVTRICELETLAVTKNRRTLRRNILHRRENVKSYIIITVCSKSGSSKNILTWPRV